MNSPIWTFESRHDIMCECHEMSPGYDYDAPNSVRRLSHNSIPTWTPNFNTIVVHGHSRITDVVTCVPIPNAGYLVSTRLREVLQQFRLPAHKYFAVPVLYRGKPLDGYSWLHLPQPQVQLTDATPIAEAEAAINSDPALADLDLLRVYLPLRYGYCFVSDRLRRALEAAKIKGVRFGTSKLFLPKWNS